jgi:dihydroorotate dehydrogenase
VERLKNTGVLIEETLVKQTDVKRRCHFDYEICFDALFDYVDYFAVNVSSPTPNLRALQDKEPLTQLLKRYKIRIWQSQTETHFA